MRWSSIATACLPVALLGLAFIRPEARPKPAFAAPRNEVKTRAESPREPSPKAVAEPGGASILSLLEVGPAEPNEDGAISDKNPAKDTAESTKESAEKAALAEAATNRQRRADRRTLRGMTYELQSALEGCSKQQLARAPRVNGTINVTMTVSPQPELGNGLLSELDIDSSRMFIPLFESCVRSELSAAWFSKPASPVQLSYSYTLAPSATAEARSDVDDSDEPADSDDSQEQEEEAS